MFLQWIRRYFKEEKGSTLPLVAVIFPVLFGVAGMGVDIGVWMKNKRNLQTAADAAALAAAWEIANGVDDNIQIAALKEAENNGFNNTTGNSLKVTVGEIPEGQSVTADITQKAPVLFSTFFMSDDLYTSVSASTAVLAPSGEYCMLSLDESADDAIKIWGSSNIDSEGCGIAVNSDSDQALNFVGAPNVNIGDLSTVGGAEGTDIPTVNYSSLTTNSRPVEDPYDDLEVPEYGDCDYNNERVNGGSTTYSDQNGDGYVVFCGGVTINSNADVTFDAGVYIMDGGDLSIGGNATVYGDGVSFIFTDSSGHSSSNLNINGGSSIEFNAPSAGEDWEGVLFYQDRNLPTSNRNDNNILGTAYMNFNGVSYFPSNDLEVGGNADTVSEGCSYIIAKTLSIHGDPDLQNDCDSSSGVRGISDSAVVKLVM